MTVSSATDHPATHADSTAGEIADYDNLAWLHIYGQAHWHCSATIIGNPAALIALRDAISVAIETGEGKAGAYCKDGEGYQITVQRTNHVGLGYTGLPYYDKFARDDSTTGGTHD